MQRGAQSKGTGADDHHISVHDASVPQPVGRVLALDGAMPRAAARPVGSAEAAAGFRARV
jgi:hypothetical protein